MSVPHILIGLAFLVFAYHSHTTISEENIEFDDRITQAERKYSAAQISKKSKLDIETAELIIVREREHKSSISSLMSRQFWVQFVCGLTFLIVGVFGSLVKQGLTTPYIKP